MDFNIKAPFEPAGDQPQAIEELVDGVNKGLHTQVLLGATGTGKTYTIAQVIARAKPIPLRRLLTVCANLRLLLRTTKRWRLSLPAS